MDLLIYLDQKNSRTEYICNHIFIDFFGLNPIYTTSKNTFLKSEKPKIQYSKKYISDPDSLFFYSVDLLFEDSINEQELTVSDYQGVKIFFLCSHKESVLPFDIFAASFYMLTRYEEYLMFEKDKIGRFPARESLAYKNNFLTSPVVDYWVLFLKKILYKKFPSLVFKAHKFQFINTIDVDNAFAYLEKGSLRTLMSLFKKLSRLQFKNIKEQCQVLFFGEKDPYDTYDYILSIHNKYNLKTFIFFLLSDYDYYDRNVNSNNKRLNEIIKQFSDTCEVGIHASFGSVAKPSKLSIEIKRLRKIVNKKVTHNRQHYIHIKFPNNYRNLIKNGIRHDYSMGFPSHPGFRAGTSYPFKFFDLQSNLVTNLIIHPFAVMDVAFKDYMNLNQEQSIEIIKKIINKIKEVDGEFISIWHNESLCFSGRWKQWKNIYINMVKYIVDG